MMRLKESIELLHYEAPESCWIEVDASSPLTQSITVPDVEEEDIDW